MRCWGELISGYPGICGQVNTRGIRVVIPIRAVVIVAVVVSHALALGDP